MKMKYVGIRPIELWDGRRCETGDIVQCTDAQVEELMARKPTVWQPETPAPKPKKATKKRSTSK